MTQVTVTLDVTPVTVVQEATTPAPAPPVPPSTYYAPLPPSSPQPTTPHAPLATSKDHRYGGEPVIVDRDADKPEVYKFVYNEEKVDYGRQK